MWTTTIEQSTHGEIRKVCIQQGSDTLSYSKVVALWQSDEPFRAFFISVLREAPYPAYYWETPPITTATIGRPFEFVLIDSPHLANVPPDAHAFASHFASGCNGNDIVNFANLGGDAWLVAPCPAGPLKAYSHIGCFAREAPEHQQHALWQAVGTAITERVGAQPLWVSTAGLGVFWLHVRLDSRPKYYSYSSYRNFHA